MNGIFDLFRRQLHQICSLSPVNWLIDYQKNVFKQHQLILNEELIVLKQLDIAGLLL